MDFEHSPRVMDLQTRLKDFMDREVKPNESKYFESVEEEGQRWKIPPIIEELKQKEERYAFAFSDLSAIRVAIDQDLVEMDSSIENAKEVAFFPPMTGG